MKPVKLILLVAFLALPCGLPGATPQSGQIVFSSNRSGAWRLWMVKADGSDLRQITKQDGDASDVDPMFSPDGKSLLFTSTRGGRTGVWRMLADGATADGATADNATADSAADNASKPERICDGDQAEWSPDRLAPPGQAALRRTRISV